MIKAQITSLGECALETLNDGSGKIVAVFNRSLYLKSNRSLCCIGSAQLPQGPLNAISTLQTMRGLAAGDPWRFKNHHLALGDGIVLNTFNASIWKPELPDCHGIDHDRQQSIADLIEQALHREKPPSNTAVAKAINQRIDTCEQNLIHWVAMNNGTQPDFIVNLIGCGDGLTPAGDDLLIGAIMTLKYFSANRLATLLAESIMQCAPERTSLIRANELLIDFFCSCMNDDTRVINSHIERLLNYGHSSGLYTLRGVKAVFP